MSTRVNIRHLPLLISFLCFFSLLKAGSISVSGDIINSTTWSDDTVFVNGHVTVADGTLLTIDTGTVIVFTGHYAIYVNGSVQAMGSPSDSILFTVQDTSGYDTLGHNGWWGLRYLAPGSFNDSSIFRYCVFEYGKADSVGEFRYGGTFYIDDFSKLLVEHSTIRNSYATKGGGVYLSNNANPTFRQVKFYNNTAEYGGAAYVFDASSPRFIRNEFRHNIAYSGGGAVAIYNQSEPLIQGCVMAENIAAVNGGGLYASFESNPSIFNSTIAYNAAGSYGGGLFFLTNSDPLIVNTIVWGNTAGKASPSVYLLDCSTEPEIYFSNIEGDTTGMEGVGSLTYPDSVYQDNLGVDPAFYDPPHDLQLKIISPLINAGRPDTNGLRLDSLDILGNTRLMYDTVDIGAMEFTIPLNLPPAQMYAPASVFCQDHVPVKVNGYPSGGTFSGAGLSGGYFYPAFAGQGTHMLVYEVDPSQAYPNSDTVYVQVIPIPVVAHQDTTACSGQFSIILSGGQPAGGTYSGANVNGNVFHVLGAGVGVHPVEYHYQDLYGCEASHTFTVSVSHPQQPIIDPVPVQCAESAPWNLSGIPAGGTFSGDYVSNGQFRADSAQAGNYSLTYTVQNGTGCISSDSLMITVSPRPSADAGLDDTICEGECVPLSGSGGNSYHWSTGSYLQDIQVCPVQDTWYNLTVTDSVGCTGTDSVFISVNGIPIADAGPGDSICPGDTVWLHALDAGPGASYTWSGGQSGQSVTVNPLSTTTYTLTVSYPNGCSASDDVTVEMKAIPQISLSQDTAICEGNCAGISVSGGNAYAWSTGDVSQNITVCPQISSTYQVTVAGNTGCDAIGEIEVTVLPNPQTHYPTDTFVCHGGCIFFPAYAQAVFQPISIYDPKIVALNKYCPENDTSYVFTRTGLNGCKTVDTVMVDVLPEIGAGIISADTAQLGDTLSLTATHTAGIPPFTYEWWPTDRLLDSVGMIVDYAPLADGKIFVKVSDSLGCKDIGYKWIEVENPLGSISGRLRLANSQMMSLKNIPMVLQGMNKVVAVNDTAWTDSQGYFWFNEVDTGYYLLNPSINGRLAWGGVNATDALLGLRHFVGLDFLSGIYAVAGDVSGEGDVNATDALQMSQRFVGNIAAFGSGDWIQLYNNIHVRYPDSMDHWVELQTLPYGDINASHQPNVKVGPMVFLEEDGEMRVLVDESLELPFYCEESDIGAYSLSIRVNDPGFWHKVSLIGPEHGQFDYRILGDELRIAWFSSEVLNTEHGKLFSLIVPKEHLNEKLEFKTLAESEISNGQGNPYSYTKITYPELFNVFSDSGFHLYPNPGDGHVTVEWSPAEAYPAYIELRNSLGQLVQKASVVSPDNGTQSIDIQHLSPGVYHLFTIRGQRKSSIGKYIKTSSR